MQTNEEEFQAKLKTLKARILKSYDGQFGTVSDPDQWSAMFERTDKDSVMSLTLVTKATGDDKRIRAVITEVTDFTSFKPFTLQLLPNHASGSLSDEIFVSYGVASRTEFPDAFNYLASEEYKTFQKSKPRIQTMSGKTLMGSSGIPIQTQR